MAARLPLVRGSGRTRQMTAGDALQLAGGLNDAALGTFAGPTATAAQLDARNTLVLNGSSLTGFASYTSGVRRGVIFNNDATITNGANFTLPGGVDMLVKSGDYVQFLCMGNASWKLISYLAAAGSDTAALLDLAGTRQMTGAIEWADAANIGPTGTAASTFLDIGAANSNVVVISGTAPGPVVWLNNAAAAKGSWRIVRFDGNYTLTYNVQRIVLPGAANIVTAVGDYAMFRYLGPVDTWECVWYTKANGRAVNPSDPTALDLAGTRPMTGALKEAPALYADSGTGSTLNLAAVDANTVYANGTGTVTALGSGSQGQTKRVYFQQSMTLRHSISLIDLPGQANIVTANGDWAEFYCAGNDSWICLHYQRRNGQALAIPTKSDLGLGQVNNTSDADKPVSTAQAAAIATKPGQNIVADPYFSQGKTAYATGTYTVVGAGDAGVPAGAGSPKLAKFALGTGITYLEIGLDPSLAAVSGAANYFQVSPGEILRISYMACLEAGARDAFIWVNSALGDGTTAGSSVPLSQATLGQFWALVTGVYTVPANCYGLKVNTRINAGTATNLFISKPYISRLTGTGFDQVDNTSDATKLAASLSQIQSYGVGGIAPTIADANISGGSRLATLSGAGLNLPIAAYGALWHHQALSNAASQFFNTTTAGRLFNRSQGSGTWTLWRELAFTDSPSFTGNVTTTGTVSAASGASDPDVGVTLGTRAFGSTSLPGTAATQVGFKTQINYARTLTGTAIGYYARDSFGDNSATAGVLSRYFGFNAEAAALGANQTITTHYGFYANAQPAGVGVAYGFISNVAVVSGKERWGCYMQGTAPNYMAADLRLGTTVQSGTDLLTVAGSTSAAGPVKCGQYTLTTLPSASAYNSYEIDVTNATVAPAGPKRCRSNGTNWIILNTTTIVS